METILDIRVWSIEVDLGIIISNHVWSMEFRESFMLALSVFVGMSR